MIMVILMFAGIFVIAVITPKLAAFIDKKRGKAPDYSQIPKAPISPFESAPLPERVEESNSFIDSSNPDIPASSKAEESNSFIDGSAPDIPASSKVEESIDSKENSDDSPAPGEDISPKNEGK